ncbi:hypothetical protein BD309DRAFT_898423 [Dichomitus squalens]|nr:hypothetical protein BD309DRAFT_898423 [Dichomitus squalens]
MDDSDLVANDESPQVAMLDGLPQHWPNLSLGEHTDNHPTPDPPQAPTPSPPHPEPAHAAVPPPPASVQHLSDSLPPPTTTDDGQPAVHPEHVNKPLPAPPPQPQHTDNPDHLKKHLAAVPPVATQPNASSNLLQDPGLKDLGWSDHAPRPAHLILGLHNGDLFTLIRRFNKQVQHVRAIPPPPPGFLDLEIAKDEEFSPDKLRANLERLYMTVMIGMAAFGKHIARLRSWNEPRRTAGFAIVYFISWYLRILPAVLICTLVTLIFHAPSRRKLFPPAPLAAISGTSGNLQVPRAGTLGSDDSLTGAPEAHQGEAVEQEASHFVASIAAVGAGTVMGQGGAPKRKHGEARAHVAKDNEGEIETEVDAQSASGDSIAGALPDPSEFALHAKNVKDQAHSGGVVDPAAQVAKKSVESAMWEKARPVMRILADVADTWERLANALEPVPPFPKYQARLRLAAVFAPLLVAAFVVPAEVVVHGTALLTGVIFFSQPILTRTYEELNRRVPNWREYLELRRTLLKGVPTNAQLTATLLRIAEEAKAPLPPPPLPRPHHTVNAARAARPDVSHPPQAAEQLKSHDFAFNTDNYEIEGVDHDHPLAHTEGEESTDEGTYVDTDRESVEGGDEPDSKKKRKHGSKMLGFIKKTTRAGVGGILGVDHLKAKVGNEHAKRRLGAVAQHDSGSQAVQEATDAHADESLGPVDEQEVERGMAESALRREGPTSFSARFHGKKGRVLIVSSAASPCLSFVEEKPLRAALTRPSKVPGIGGDVSDGLAPEITVGIADIVALRKVGGFGWKGKLVVGWATGKDVLDGLEIVDRWGERKVITAIKGRDELFNRLIAMGGQKWECL